MWKQFTSTRFFAVKNYIMSAMATNNLNRHCVSQNHFLVKLFVPFPLSEVKKTTPVIIDFSVGPIFEFFTAFVPQGKGFDLWNLCMSILADEPLASTRFVFQEAWKVENSLKPSVDVCEAAIK